MLYIGIIFFTFIDLLSKFIAKIYLGDPQYLIGNFLYLRYIENPGIAFSIPIEGIILKILTLGIICVIFFYYYSEDKKQHNNYIDFSYMLILSGAIGNGYERIFHSKVVDFIGIKYFSIFNIADAYITLGVILYIGIFIYLHKKNHE